MSKILNYLESCVDEKVKALSVLWYASQSSQYLIPPNQNAYNDEANSMAYAYLLLLILHFSEVNETTIAIIKEDNLVKTVNNHFQIYSRNSRFTLTKEMTFFFVKGLDSL